MMHDFEKIRVLITGAGGYLGSFLRDSLSEIFDVISIDAKGGNDVVADLKNESSWENLEKHLLPKNNYLIHMAFIYENSEEDLRSKNDVIFKNLLKFMKRNSSVFLIFPSSALVYGTNVNDKIAEEHTPLPNTIYGKIKFEQEQVLRKDYLSRTSILRMSNVYSNKSGSNTVFGRILQCLRNKEKISLKDYNSIRDFIHIDDLIKAYEQLILYSVQYIKSHRKEELKNPFDIFNISTGTGVSIYELASLASEAAGFQDLLPKKSEILKVGRGENLVLDSQKLVSTLALLKQKDQYNSRQLYNPVNIKEGIKRINFYE